VETETPNGDANEETKPNVPVAFDAQQQINAMLKDICEGRKPQDNGTDKASDLALDQLHYKDFPTLRQAVTKLAIKSHDKKLGVFIRACITAMVGTLNLYLDSELSYSWHEASLVVSKTQGQGSNHACNI